MRNEEPPMSDSTINVSCYSAKSERKMPSLDDDGDITCTPVQKARPQAKAAVLGSCDTQL